MFDANVSSQGGEGRVALTRDQVMTAAEVAELLQLPVSTVYYLAREGKLPASRLGRTYRFLRPRLEAMLNAEPAGRTGGGGRIAGARSRRAGGGVG